LSEHWFHLNPIPPASETSDSADHSPVAELGPEEARHAAGALRLARGDAIRLFDGQGLTAVAQILELSPKKLRVQLLSQRHEPPASPELHLASALPKGDRQSLLLNMACQLGMRSFTPLSCERSVAKAGPSAPDRWHRILREACKQSHRAWLPSIHEPRTPGEHARQCVARGDLYLFHPGGNALSDLEEPERPAGASVYLMLGPEGGFSDQEVSEVHELGGRIAALGQHPLRIETAGVAALALLGLGTRLAPASS
jgi:16S rRNA (uracil1498-N3)-methyltransferase